MANLPSRILPTSLLGPFQHPFSDPPFTNKSSVSLSFPTRQLQGHGNPSSRHPIPLYLSRLAAFHATISSRSISSHNVSSHITLSFQNHLPDSILPIFRLFHPTPYDIRRPRLISTSHHILFHLALNHISRRFLHAVICHA